MKLKEIVPQVNNPRLVEKTHHRIFRAASKLFSKKGYHRTTMREIAATAKINPAYLYKYVSSKDDILYLFYLELNKVTNAPFVRLEEETGGDAVERLKTFLQDILTTSLKYERELLTMYTESRHLEKPSLRSILSLEAKRVKAIEGLIEDGVQQGVFHVADIRLTAELFMLSYPIFYPFRAWSIRNDYSREDFIHYAIEAGFNLLGVRPNDR